MSNIRNRIKEELGKRGAVLPCARCGQNKFGLMEDFARVEQQKNFQNITLGGPSVPCAVVICENCGNISLHALGALGMMDAVSPKEEEEEKGESNE